MWFWWLAFWWLVLWWLAFWWLAKEKDQCHSCEPIAAKDPVKRVPQLTIAASTTAPSNTISAVRVVSGTLDVPVAWMSSNRLRLNSSKAKFIWWDIWKHSVASEFPDYFLNHDLSTNLDQDWPHFCHTPSSCFGVLLSDALALYCYSLTNTCCHPA